MQTNNKDVKPRRLGRGLSALIGQPVQVEVAPTHGTSSAKTTPQSAKAPSGPAEARAELGDGQVAAGVKNSQAQNATSQGDVVITLELERVQPGRFQPRRVFDENGLKELAASIAAGGLVQPIVVRPVNASGASGGGAGYELIAGERRWRAAKLAGIAAIPAIVREVSDERAAEWSLVENLQRADLTAMERAEALANLCTRFGLSHQQAADKIGMDRSSVANLVRLLELEPPIRELLDRGVLSGGHGKALLAAPAGSSRVALAKIAGDQGWSVRKLELAAKNAGVPGGASASVNIQASDKAMSRAAALRDLEKQLGEHLGTAVAIRASSSGKRGSVVLKFYDLDHFDGLMSKMGFRLR